MLIEKLKTPTLVIAHREELLNQAREKILCVCPDADVGILQAKDHSGLHSHICVASVQTAVRHIPKLAARGFRLLICDEAHHAVSQTYTRVFSELGFMDNAQDKLLLGVTATAYRGDKVGLEAVFQEIVFERSILDMMLDGYLCDIQGLSVKTHASLAKVRIAVGDFAVDELAVAIDTPERNELIVDTYLQHGKGRRGVVFGVKVDHALHLAEAFRQRKVPCEAVWGGMPAEKRHDVLKRYADGELKILTNVGVLTEGWDVPETDIIMMARPTKSKVLYVQCVGRGLRPAEGKKNCLLVDFVDVAAQHDLCGIATLAGRPLKAQNGQVLSFLKAMEEEGQNIPLPTALIVYTASTFDPLRRPSPSLHFSPLLPWKQHLVLHYAVTDRNTGKTLWVCDVYPGMLMGGIIGLSGNMERLYWENGSAGAIIQSTPPPLMAVCS